MSSDSRRKAVFVDRDGTLIKEVNFLSQVDDLELFPYTDESVQMLKDQGYLIIVVTNQSGIGRGIYSEADMHAIHDEIQDRLSAKIDGFYFCPHLPEAGCQCRKPGLGMIESACEDFEIDLANSWFVGDKGLDVETGLNAGMKTMMVLTGYGAEHSNILNRRPDRIVTDLLEAAQIITEERSVGA